MQWATTVDPSRKHRDYEEDPYWFAWYPIVAETETGEFRRVWREFVRQSRHCRTVGDGYGGVCKEIYYLYFTVNPDQQPEREPYWHWFWMGALVPFAALFIYANFY